MNTHPFRAAVIIIIVLIALSKEVAVAQVPYQRIVRADSDPSSWLTYSGNYQSHRFSALTQINRQNVAQLKPAWVYQMRNAGIVETTPIVADGVMYITEPPSTVTALDARSGRPLWTYTPKIPTDVIIIGSPPVNRGVAILDDTIFLGTVHSHLIALDRRSGAVRWDTVVDDNKKGYYLTLAPLAIDGKIIVGVSGAETGIRGFVDAYDAKTGKRDWRFYTVPSPKDQEEHAKKALKTWEGKSWLTGGGSAWVTGTYDPDLNTLYWGVGNPSPDFNGEVRKGDNLYTVSVVALNPDDGTYKWHFQASPHDVWDYDGVNEPVLVDFDKDGKKVKAFVQAHRNGYFYCINRENGKFIYGKPFCELTWTDRTKGVDGLDPETGRPFVNPKAMPTEKGVRVCPGAAGGKEWNPMAYHPGTELAYVPVINNCAKFTSGKAFFIKGQPYWGSSLTLIDNQASGSFKAIDVKTGKSKWEVATRSPMVAGVLATGGGLVFTGDAEGFFTAYDADDGKILWNFQCGSGHHASPVTYTLDGRQYIAVCVGWGGWVAGFAGDGAPWLRNARRGNTVFVFALPKEE